MPWPSLAARTKNWGTETLTDADLEGQLDLIITYINDMMDSTNGHKHDGTTAEGPRLASGGVSTTFGNGFTTVTGASGDYLLIAADVSDSNTTKKALASDYIFTPSSSNALAGSVVQVVSTQTGAVSTGTTDWQWDDTIPQNTEGDEYMTRSITPTSATNKLKITVVAYLSIAGGTQIGYALFQDSTANALIAGGFESATAADLKCVTFVHYMTSGTTSSTTFKFRAGVPGSETMTFNGTGGSRLFGGVLGSSITIEEIKV